MNKKILSLILCGITAASLLTGCGKETSISYSDISENGVSQAVPPENVDIANYTAPEIGDTIIEMDIKDYGTVKFRLFPEYAEKGTENFIELAKKGYYFQIVGDQWAFVRKALPVRRFRLQKLPARQHDVLRHHKLPQPSPGLQLEQHFPVQPFEPIARFDGTGQHNSPFVGKARRGVRIAKLFPGLQSFIQPPQRAIRQLIRRLPV